MERAEVDVQVASGFRVAAMPRELLDRVRAAGVDDLGNELVTTISTDGGEPLRCCLRDAAPGERIALLAHRPFPWDGPYAEVGPVFVHADACGGYAAVDAYPEGFRPRQQVFRAYGHDRTIVESIVVDGADAEPALAGLLARADVDFVHSRNVAYGCYMFSLHRP
jgi:hypothetical protein